MTFVLASNNAKKLLEMQDILNNLGIEVVSQKSLGIDSEPDETGATFEENALIKARACCKIANIPAIADDSGLEVDTLDGAPGIFSARYCEGTDEDRVNFLLKNMESCENRAARFVSAVACVFQDGREFVCRGECEGEVLRQRAGDGGFGYDPVFNLPQYGQTFAQIPQEVKNKISHRAKAMEQFIDAVADFVPLSR